MREEGYSANKASGRLNALRSVTPEGGDSIQESRRWQARLIEKMKVVIIKDSESLG